MILNSSSAAADAAVGKSAAAIALAERVGGEIISADSRQIYRGMDIGTAKPTPEERIRVPHYGIDLLPPDAAFSVGQFRAYASGVIERLLPARRVPIVVGGTGLYVRGLLYGLWAGPAADWALRRGLLQEEQRAGSGHLHRRLAELDPEAAGRIHPNDQAKIVRALEVVLLTGTPLSEHHRGHQFRDRCWRARVLGLRRARADLYQRIDRRVDGMLAAGLVAEVRALAALGYTAALSSMRGLGYRQILGYLLGHYGLDAAVEQLKRDTRRYAKRQETWFCKQPEIDWIDLAPEDDVAAVVARIQERLEHRRSGHETEAYGIEG